jgi:ribosomal protein S18 acetylase RimI-like enzyme
VEYRIAREADIPGMALVRDVGEHYEFMRDRMARYLAGDHHPRHALLPRAVFVAALGDQVVGYVAGHLTTRYDCDGELQWLYVLAEHRGTEVAPKLLRLMAAWFAERQASRVCVNVDPANTAARRFYKRHGAQDLNPQWLIWEDISVILAD